MRVWEPSWSGKNGPHPGMGQSACTRQVTASGKRKTRLRMDGRRTLPLDYFPLARQPSATKLLSLGSRVAAATLGSPAYLLQSFDYE